MGLQKTTPLSSEPDLLSLLLCLQNYIQQHGESSKPFELLHGLTDLSIVRVERGEDSKIASTALQAMIETNADSDKSPGSKLGSPWRTLTERTLIDRVQGIQEFFFQQGHSHYLWPMKDKSPGGAGNASMYFFEARKIHDKKTTTLSSNPTEISYISEITPRPAWVVSKLLTGGYRLLGWRRWLLIGFGLATFLIVILFALTTWLLLAYSSNLTLQLSLTLIFSSLIVAWLGYSLISPLVKLIDWRLIKAPEILVSINEQNVLVELVKEKQASGKPTKIIRLVRYAGTCPICSNKVEVVDGKKEFPNRFVGRCEESPAEHVYSFDRITLRGKLLR